MTTLKTLAAQNPVLHSYLFYSSVLILKMLAMSLLTIRERFRNNVVSSEEDVVLSGGKISFSNENVERTRRCHRNDLEIILPFLIAAFGFAFTDPDPEFADSLFFYFTASRIIHTFVYTVWVLPQPARVMSWFMGFVITVYISFKSFFYFRQATLT